MIKLQVIGNLGKDALVNQVNGKNVINFNVAHTERYKDATGQQKERTTWVECAYWTDRIGVAPYLKRGSQVYVEGIPEVRQYTRNDGTAGASLSLRVVSLQLVGQRPEQGGATNGNYGQNGGYQTPASAPSEAYPAASGTPQADGPDDLPF
jgi:single-strand DNA-binding protein